MRGTGIDFDTKISTGDREVSKERANVFFRLKQGEFITYADGKDRKVQFKLPNIVKQLPKQTKEYSEYDLQQNFDKVYREARSIF